MITRLSFLTSMIFIVLSLTMTSQIHAQQALDKSEVGKIIREYLLENPELLLEVQDALSEKQQQELSLTQAKIIADKKDVIFSGDYQIEIGNPQAEITVVEFFDYNCGFCQRALQDMETLLETNKNIKFILKEFPVLGEASIEASRVSMAVAKLLPEKHAEFHTKLLAQEGQKDGNRAVQLAAEMGATQIELMVEMENPKIIETIQKTYEIANDLGITGTPSYIIGSEVVFGAVGHDQLNNKIINLSK